MKIMNKSKELNESNWFDGLNDESILHKTVMKMHEQTSKQAKSKTRKREALCQNTTSIDQNEMRKNCKQ